MAKAFPNTGATVIDTSADLPAASAALEGVMMFQKDTNELKICDGANWISMLDTDTPNAMELLGVNTFSSSTGFFFSNIFSSKYDNYRLYMSFNAMSASANTAIKIRTANGTTAQTATNYSFHRFVGYSNTYVSGTTAGVNSMDIGFVDPTYPNWAHLIVDICNPFLTGFFTHFHSNSYAVSNAGARHVDLYNGELAMSDSYNGIFVFPSNGNFGGKAVIYGIRS